VSIRRQRHVQHQEHWRRGTCCAPASEHRRPLRCCAPLTPLLHECYKCMRSVSFLCAGYPALVPPTLSTDRPPQIKPYHSRKRDCQGGQRPSCTMDEPCTPCERSRLLVRPLIPLTPTLRMYPCTQVPIRCFGRGPTRGCTCTTRTNSLTRTKPRTL
jgi:hypothetical protein